MVKALQGLLCLRVSIIIIIIIIFIYYYYYHYYFDWGISVCDHKGVGGSITDNFTILKLDYVWNWVHPASWGQSGSYYVEK